MHTTIAIQPVTENTAPVSTAVNCARCGMQKFCLPTNLKPEDVQRLDRIIMRRRRIERGTNLYRMNDAFSRIYAIRFGHFKTYQVNPRGEQQINGFQMPGELLGLDAIGAERHQCGAVALEDSEVCEIPFDKLEGLLGDIPELLRHFHRLIGQEITREQNAMLLLATMRAEQRVAIFLTNLGARLAARGYAEHRFQLRMMREEVGNYLGLTVESVSRLISRFRHSGLLRVANREVEILDPVRMREIAAGVRLDA
ncbi:fumarate/nitrate reduction transcriptional regulator Fnr [Duganella radicis]|uniref:Fumarate/nitrate reduction transcriptional regulator Fnr n=1 Tax=Duganella radicis TaxID=551988 RepID=A0A6L6PB97_9BURK|nr:fumarate/nitrate reduction transcriptional regulator Fnr [Duganella radicis]MTV36356.1 fumarate/nitrate reduction transcriptional regulator Fnr [Duganella radicis]